MPRHNSAPSAPKLLSGLGAFGTEIGPQWRRDWSAEGRWLRCRLLGTSAARLYSSARLLRHRVSQRWLGAFGAEIAEQLGAESAPRLLSRASSPLRLCSATRHRRDAQRPCMLDLKATRFRRGSAPRLLNNSTSSAPRLLSRQAWPSPAGAWQAELSRAEVGQAKTASQAEPSWRKGRQAESSQAAQVELSRAQLRRAEPC